MLALVKLQAEAVVNQTKAGVSVIEQSGHFPYHSQLLYQFQIDEPHDVPSRNCMIFGGSQIETVRDTDGKAVVLSYATLSLILSPIIELKYTVTFHTWL